MNRQVFIAMALLMIAPTIQASADWCAKDWCVRGQDASTTTTSTGISLAVFFALSCEDAILMVQGNDSIQSGFLVIDGDVFRPSDFRPFSINSSALALTPEALSAIKHGIKGALVTDQGTIGFSLMGSRPALNAAYENCMANFKDDVSDVLSPMQPSPKPAMPVPDGG